MKKYIRVIIISILFFMLFSNTSGAEPLTLTRFLATAEQDYRLKNHAELASYFKGEPVAASYFEKIEFRTETREFDIMKQKYSFRFYPRTRGEIRYTDMISETAREIVKAEHDALFSESLKKRYDLALDFLEALSLLNMKKTLLVVYEDEVNVLRKMSMSDLSFDVGSLVSAEEQYIDLQLETAQLESELNNTIEIIKSIAGYSDEIAFDREELISPERIQNKIQDIQPVPNSEDIRLRHQMLKTDIAENKYLLEKAKNKKILSFVNLGYDTDAYDDIDKSFSIEAGFNLPFVSPDTEKMNSEKKRWLDEKLKYENEKNAISESIRTLSASLNRLIRHRQILMERKTESNAEVTFRKYKKIEGINPLTLLKIKGSILKRDMQVNRKGWLILRQYIDLMDITGRLSERPLKNYLL